MDNRDFLPYMRVAKLPEFNPSFISSSPSSPSYSLISWLFKRFRSFYRYCYVHLHDLILSSLFGYLTLNEKLYVAVHKNDLYNARQLLSHGASPSYIPVDYKTIFTHLIRNNNEIENYCIETSLFASILASDSMLYIAVSNNNLNLIKQLINYHNYGHVSQHTEVVSLCLAVKRCYFNIAEYLINYGKINPNDCVQTGCKHCKSDSYRFPLYHACHENHIKLVKYLIESKKCDVNQLTTSYETCLHGAILGAIENRFDSSASNQQRYFIVKYLLNRPDCQVDLGLNPLCVSLAHDNIYDYTSLLLNYQCDVNRLGWNRFEMITNSKQNTHLPYSLDHPLNICLHRLCQTNENATIADHSYHKQHALKLIELKSNIYAMYDHGPHYPFLLAIQTGDKTIVEMILKYSKDEIRLNIIEPLISACTKSFYDIVKVLVDFGFDPNAIMINRDSLKSTNPITNPMNSSEFLKYLNHYCTFSVDNSPSRLYISPDQQLTAFLALSRMSTWIFHPDKYESTIKTIENLFSRIPIDFTIRSNRLAFYYALLNEHMPIVYYCLANFAPIYLPHQTIDFAYHPLKNNFSYTLFHLISVCCRLTSNNRVKRILFDSYAKTILRIHTYDRSTSMANVLAYMKLWLGDEDFVFDSILFEHLMSLPYIDDIIEVYDANKLRSIFHVHYQRIIERRPRSRSMHTLKHLCRLKIRQQSQIYCEYHQTNLLKIIPYLDCLPRILQAYLFYTKIQSKSLINYLLNNELWNNIQWM